MCILHLYFLTDYTFILKYNTYCSIVIKIILKSYDSVSVSNNYLSIFYK